MGHRQNTQDKNKNFVCISQRIATNYTQSRRKEDERYHLQLKGNEQNLSESLIP